MPKIDRNDSSEMASLIVRNKLEWLSNFIRKGLRNGELNFLVILPSIETIND
jgi:hypothetical protein